MASRSGACPNMGSRDVAPARGAAGMPAVTCLRTPAEQQCVGARTAVIADSGVAHGALTTVCGRPCGDRSQPHNSLSAEASTRRSWRAGFPRRSRARCAASLVDSRHGGHPWPDRQWLASGLGFHLVPGGELKDLRRRGDLRFRRLQNRIPPRRPQVRRCRVKAAPNRILAGD